MDNIDASGYSISITPYSNSSTILSGETELRKVRINILDKETGDAVEEVDVYTSADSVLFSDGRYLPDELVYITSYTNSVKTPTTIGGIAEGSIFSSISFNDLITQLLYPYIAPSFTFSSTIAKRYYESGTDISPITFTANVAKKSNSIVAVDLWKGSSKYDSFKNFPTGGGTGTYNYTEKLDTTSSFQLKVNDGEAVYSSDPITVIFNSPIYYGSTNQEVTEAIFKSMNKYIEYDDINDIGFSGVVSPNKESIIFAYKSYTGSNEVVKVYDTNGMDITSSFDTGSVQILVGSSILNYTYWKSNITKQSDFKITIKIQKL